MARAPIRAGALPPGYTAPPPSGYFQPAPVRAPGYQPPPPEPLSSPGYAADPPVKRLVPDDPSIPSPYVPKTPEQLRREEIAKALGVDISPELEARTKDDRQIDFASSMLGVADWALAPLGPPEPLSSLTAEKVYGSSSPLTAVLGGVARGTRAALRGLTESLQEGYSPERRAEQERQAAESAALRESQRSESPEDYIPGVTEVKRAGEAGALALKHMAEDPGREIASAAGMLTGFRAPAAALEAISGAAEAMGAKKAMQLFGQSAAERAAGLKASGISPQLSNLITQTWLGAGLVKTTAYENIMGLSPEELRQIPEYQDLVDHLGEKDARLLLADRAQSYAENPGEIAAGALLGAGAAVVGDRLAAARAVSSRTSIDELQRAAARGPVASALVSGGREAVAMGGQMAGQTALGNVAAGKVSPTIEASKGVGEAAASGAVMGFGLGALGSGAETARAREELARRPAYQRESIPVEATARTVEPGEGGAAPAGEPPPPGPGAPPAPLSVAEQVIQEAVRRGSIKPIVDAGIAKPAQAAKLLKAASTATPSGEVVGEGSSGEEARKNAVPVESSAGPIEGEPVVGVDVPDNLGLPGPVGIEAPVAAERMDAVDRSQQSLAAAEATPLVETAGRPAAENAADRGEVQGLPPEVVAEQVGTAGGQGEPAVGALDQARLGEQVPARVGAEERGSLVSGGADQAESLRGQVSRPTEGAEEKPAQVGAVGLPVGERGGARKPLPAVGAEVEGGRHGESVPQTQAEVSNHEFVKTLPKPQRDVVNADAARLKQELAPAAARGASRAKELSIHDAVGRISWQDLRRYLAPGTSVKDLPQRTRRILVKDNDPLRTRLDTWLEDNGQEWNVHSLSELGEKLMAQQPYPHPAGADAIDAQKLGRESFAARDIAKAAGMTPKQAHDALVKDRGNKRELALKRVLAEQDPYQSQEQLAEHLDREERRKEPELRGPVGRFIEENPRATRAELQAEIKRLRQERDTDELSGLGNRRAMVESERTAGGIAMGDSAGLKWLNDTYGHGAGDEFLSMVGKITKMISETEAMRDFDVRGFRPGGDEFAIHAATPEAVEAASEIVSELVAKAPITVTEKDGSKTRLTGFTLDFGTGSTRESADGNLLSLRASKQAAGQRAERGERPFGLRVESSSKAGLDRGAEQERSRGGSEAPARPQAAQETAPSNPAKPSEVAPSRAVSTEKTKAGTQTLLPEDVNRAPLFTQDEEAEKRADAERQSTIGDTGDTGDTGEKFAVAPSKSRDLILQHNLSAANLIHADKIGGLPVPSMAISRIGAPIEGFGDITLLGDESFADPRKSGMQVFGGDIYSPRYPTIRYRFGNDRVISDALKESNAVLGYSDWFDEAKKHGLDALSSGNPNVVWTFLKSKGIEPDVKMAGPSQERIAQLRKVPGLEKFFGVPRYQFNRDPGFIRLAMEELKQRHESLDPEDREVLDRIGLTADQKANVANHLSYELEDIGRNKVERGATRDSLRDQLKTLGLEPEFDRFAADLFERAKPEGRIFKGFTNSGNEKTIAHTLENVVDEMKRNLKAGEGFSYGPGMVRGAVTPQFKSLESIRSAKGRLVSKAEMEKAKDEINDAFWKVAERIPNSGGDFGHGDRVVNFMLDVAKMGMPRAMREWNWKLSDSQQQAVADFMESLRHVPTEYFEAKLKRAVGIDEFKAAVVPSDVDKRVLDILKKHGLEVETYDRNSPGARQQAIQAVSDAHSLSFAVAPGQSPSVRRPLTLDVVKRAIPGLPWEKSADGTFAAKLKDGRILRLDPAAQFFDVSPGKLAESAKAAGVESPQPVGSYAPFGVKAETLIKIASGAPLGTADHEGLHFLWDVALDPREKAALMKKYGGEEEAAYAYSEWRRKQDRKPDSLWQKILNWVRRLVHYFRPTWESTFREAASGRAAGRVGESRGRGGFATEPSADRGVDQSALIDFARGVESRHGLERFDLLSDGNDIVIAVMVTPKAKRSQGRGSAAMKDLLAFADENGKRIVVTPARRGDLEGVGPTSYRRTESFYERFGFVKNKGANRDETANGEMYRNPIDSNVGIPDPNNPDIRYATAPAGEDSGGALILPEETFLDQAERKLRDQLQRVGVVQRSVEEQTGVKARRSLQDEFQGVAPRAQALSEYADAVAVQPLMHQVAKDKLDFQLLGEFAQARHAPDRDVAILNDHLMAAAEAKTGKPPKDVQEAVATIGVPAAKKIRAKFGNGSGMTPARVEEILAKVKATGKEEKYLEARDKILDIQAMAMDILVKSGVTTPERVAALREKFGPEFVSLRDENPEGLEKFMSAGPGYSVRGPEWQRARGRTSEASAHPLLAAIQSLDRAILRSERNAAENDFANWVEQVGDSELGTVRKGAPDANGVGFKRNGEQWAIDLPDERLRNAVKSLSVNQKDLLSQTMGGFTRWFSRVNTQLSVPFVFRNGARDYGGAVISSYILHGNKPLVIGKGRTTGGQSVPEYVALHEQTAIRAAWNYMRDPAKAWAPGTPEAYAAEAIRNGAVPGYFNAVESLTNLRSKTTAHLKDALPIGDMLKLSKAEIGQTMASDLPPVLKGARVIGTSLDAAWRASVAGKVFMDHLKLANNVVEAATRINYYTALRKTGMSARDAADKARQLIDFSRKGEISPSLNAIWAFFHASVEGEARLAEMLRSKDPGVKRRAWGVMAALVAAGALWDAFVAAISGDKDEDGVPDSDQIPMWASERAAVIPAIGNLAPIIIPFAQGFNVPFFMGQLASKVARGRMRIGSAAYELAVSAANAFNPIGTTYGMPTAVQPVVEVLANEDWRGRPIAPTRYPGMEGLPDSSLSGKRTSPMAKAFAQGLNRATGGTDVKPGLMDVGPDTLDHYAQFLAGGAGRFFMDTMSALQQTFHGEMPGKIPLVSSFTLDPESAYRSRFYEQLNAIEAANNRVRTREKQSRLESLPPAVREKASRFSISDLRDATENTWRPDAKWLADARRDIDLQLMPLSKLADASSKLLKELNQQPPGPDRDEKMRRLYLTFNKRFQKAMNGVVE